MAFDSSMLAAVNGSRTTNPMAAGTKMGVESAGELNDRFMRLLVTQLQNQDPLNPMENSEFTSQLAQINTVSGINSLNQTLSSITEQMNASQKLQAGAMVGRGVLVEGNEVWVNNRAEGEEGGNDSNTVLPFGVELGGAAASARAVIKDPATGEIVNEYDLTKNGPLKSGVQYFTWDGTNASGEKVANGKYQVSISATDSAGNAVKSSTLQYGYVSGVMTSGEEPMLDLGPNIDSVALNQVKQIL
ncbi:flagellar hook assembly protein FlgD [Kushneria aurantia]|uniref:Basal-body rod modification protein FlgD n=1 Tax=Kushneria aurantia TaxID=504092 RepID=A0ABV6G0Y7_9GAMM|nr:flagellar hook assembly protein FlgD [Kushneria aurantia]